MQADGPVAWVDTLTYSGEIMFGPRDADARGRLLIPVARFRKEGGRLARLPFAPPALRLYPEGGLRETVMDVLELLRAKGRELEDYKLSLGRDRGPASDSRERALAAALGIVVRHVARLNGLLNASCAHPCAAYAALSELASELSPFGPEGAGTALAPYDHGDPGPCFLAARDSVARSLEALSPGPELSLPFRRDGESFSCEIPPGSDPALSFFIAARSEARAEEFKQSMPLKARLASPARLAELVAWGLPGVGLTPVREAPAGLPRRPDAAYFSVRKQDPLWEEAFASGRIEIRWSGAPEKVQLLLVGVRQ
jgi:type VI secretion system protein ImpJ